MIIKKTNSQKVNLVGHSEGSAASLILVSTKQEYQDKVGIIIALAPATFMYNANNFVLKIIGKQQNAIYKAVHEIIQKQSETSSAIDSILSVQCTSTLKAGSFCRFLFEKIRDRASNATLNELFGIFPEPITKKSFLRYAQHFKKNIFQMANLGTEKNLQKYKCNTPPEYNLDCIKTPVAILFAENDYLIAKNNIDNLKNKLGNVVSFSNVSDPDWNHYDFILNNEIPTQIVPIICENLEKFNI